MTLWPIAAVAATGLFLGARHGLDWDHVTALADLVGSQGQRGRRSLALAFWYCVGHGTVIVLLGAMVGMLGVRLPGGLDRIFEVVVGLTLIALGLLVLSQVWRQRGSYRYVSRWRLLIDLVRRAWLRRRSEVDWDATRPLSHRTAFSVGVLHGTGAETPTQVVLFASAAAAGSQGLASLVLLAFVGGLIASDLCVAALWLGGRLASTRRPSIQVALGVLTGVASVTVGTVFILGRSGVFPSLVGG
jgi:high-affinity nickel permease